MVNKYKIPYKDTKLFSKLVMDYLDENSKLKPFITNFPSLKNFKKLIKCLNQLTDTNPEIDSEILLDQVQLYKDGLISVDNGNIISSSTKGCITYKMFFELAE